MPAQHWATFHRHLRHLLITHATPTPPHLPTRPPSPAGCPKLAGLRAAMAAADGGRGVSAYLVPTEDPHMSEYPPARLKYREWISK